jgi:hypothetical protein
LPRPLIQSLMAGLKSLRLELLDDGARLSTRASGFLIQERDGLFLYTCWHVVMGVDFLNPTPLSAPNRKTVIVHSQDVQQRQPGVTSIGKSRSFEVPLYDGKGAPRWLQEPNERVHPDLNAIGLRVPKFVDLVRIPVELDPVVAEVVAFDTQDIFVNRSGAGEDVVIVGYPYGYSAMDVETPEPIFLKRGVASIRTSNVGVVLLDGGGTPGMSGAPIIRKLERGWWLEGVYTGILFPDQMFGPVGKDNDRFAALGMMVPIQVARAVMQVPGLFDQSS